MWHSSVSMTYYHVIYQMSLNWVHSKTSTDTLQNTTFHPLNTAEGAFCALQLDTCSVKVANCYHLEDKN